jgi:hypothetical protein
VSEPNAQRSMSPEVRWTVGCLVAGAATTGALILLLLAAYALQPPVWLQIALGVGLALGGALFAGLVASALKQRDRGPSLTPVDSEEPPPSGPSKPQ